MKEQPYKRGNYNLFIHYIYLPIIDIYVIPSLSFIMLFYLFPSYFYL